MSSNLPKRNRTDQMLADQRLIEGFTRHAATVTSVLVDGVVMSVNDIIAMLQARIAASQNATSAKANWQAAVIADTTEHARTRTSVAGLRQAMMVAFGAQLDTLADFGLAPRKVRVQTPDQTIAATAKAKATREARHTLGKVQRSKITGAHPAGASAGASVGAAAGSGPAPASKA
jgi:uncharacterized protein (DUF427 family)